LACRQAPLGMPSSAPWDAVKRGALDGTVCNLYYCLHMQDDQEKLKPYLQMARERGADHALVIKPASIITAPWVRVKCQFGCFGYGRGLCCPPNTPTPEQMRGILDSFVRAILLHRHWQKGIGVVDQFNEMLVDIERALFLDGFYKAWAMGSGPCRRCKKCDTTGTCLHADRARPSLEACGIDVFATARGHDLPIEVVRTHKDEREIFGVVLVE
jgi:predicted metal-binding protein